MSTNKNLVSSNKNVFRTIRYSSLILLCWVVSIQSAYAQLNLVVDPSFELQVVCDSNQEIYGAKNWHALDSTNNTVFPTSSCSPAYFNSCCVGCPTSLPSNTYTGLNFQYPKTGNGMYGMEMYLSPSVNSLYNRDYLRGRIRTNLINNHTYCGKFYVNLFNTQYFGIDRICAYLDNGTLDVNNECLPIIVTPTFENPAFNYITDTIGWTKIQGVFTANGNESYITIGNFYNEVNTHKIIVNSSSGRFGEAYYYIDDVSIIPMSITAFAGNDVSICLSDSIALGRPREIGLECEWYSPGNAVAFSSGSQFTFKPKQTGTYSFIQKMDNCRITYDTVTVTVVEDCNSLLVIPNVFTPNEDGTNDSWHFEMKNASNLNYCIYNRWGNLIKNFGLKEATVVDWDGRTTSGEACTAGVYFYVLSYTDAKGDSQKKNGYITLIK